MHHHDDTIELLRFSTCGSVDDGKSTLIGRLLYDSKALHEDTIAAIDRSSKRAGKEELDLSLVTDGLKDEREQGITIDVAYRYFSTPKRRFIIADTPGHEQYTRNMITGASTAELAIILIDARKGVLVQSRRHAILASLLRIPHLIVAINKMDLVGWDEKIYNDIRAEFTDFAARLGLSDLDFIPMSALNGDNVVDRSTSTPWYQGPTLMYKLETVAVGTSRNMENFRLPVQRVIRPDLDYRGFAGQIASGVVKVGDKIVSLPSGKYSTVKSIDTYEGSLPEAFAPQSVSITLNDEIDSSRGDMLVHAHDVPHQSQEVTTTLCWLNEKSLVLNRPYWMRHNSREVKAMVTSIDFRLDINTLDRHDATELKVNEVARVRLRLSAPIFYDAYARNRGTGSFVLVDTGSNVTMAAGMLAAPSSEPGQGPEFAI
jgi:sulfate adenylyltransferase large subunit